MSSERVIRDDILPGLAAELDRAEASGVQLAPFSERFPGMTIADAYAVQRAWVAQKIADGRHILGHKIGLTSRAMQLASQIAEPDYGALLDDMFFEPNGDIPLSRFVAPKVEVELAFVLKSDLRGPGVTVFDVLRATEYVTPAAEIIDARIQRVSRETGHPRRVTDTISDNAANAGVILGGRAVRPDDLDLRWAAALCVRNGVIEETGVAAGVLGHPATGIAWLANRLAPHGEGLQAGEVVLAGSFTRPVDIASGDVFTFDYGRLGTFSCRFTGVARGR
ncbi:MULTISPECIES: 2-oxo-hept-4-ene-1,7-dioate hydratase [Deinococcus]|uniref:2-oxohept-3-enedioate hydratase n=1 Tax=Deinococcus geothermalis (strain DSM 11300 / CIP 105573 / AG-3a) TaxID=319795 RepID=Q1J3T0_DEIGD|nr:MULTISPECIES: 2-oxo-hepta-3-ene-1,7-dioic acid hydratase [Deinococcus]ABF43854.1 2-oxohept-3-enedioate hydratase [Deinococcus geothermalis DSM 11300]TDE85287.1 2-oxo-hepta-3-ene-1,7-dioic acid hydratase [Deinococcus sp. S9]